MFLIDENISELEVLRLRRAGVRVRLIGDDVARVGISDEDLVRSLRRLKRPVLFSQDEDFFQFQRLHKDYALVWLDVHPTQVAEYIRRFICHPEFNTQAKRMGIIARVGRSGIKYWRVDKPKLLHMAWA